jgi:hypothetical protein
MNAKDTLLAKIDQYGNDNGPIAKATVQFFVGLMVNFDRINKKFESVLEAGMAVAAGGKEAPENLKGTQAAVFSLVAVKAGEQIAEDIQAGTGMPFVTIVKAALPAGMSNEEKDKFIEKNINFANEIFSEYMDSTE